MIFIYINVGADSQLERLFEKYRYQQKIKHKSLKCLFTGPPRVGKTTLKKRLLKVIKNLITSGVVKLILWAGMCHNCDTLQKSKECVKCCVLGVV